MIKQCCHHKNFKEVTLKKFKKTFKEILKSQRKNKIAGKFNWTTSAEKLTLRRSIADVVEHLSS